MNSSHTVQAIHSITLISQKTNQNEVVQIHVNFFEDFRIRELIRENELVILNLQKKIRDSEFIKIIRKTNS